MIIAISGFKRSGKDTAADYLRTNHNFTSFSFAYPLKNMVSECFDIERSYLDDPKFKESPLLQYPVPAADKYTEMVSNFMVREFRTKDGRFPEAKDLRINNGTLQTFTSDWEDLYHTPRSLAILIGSSMRSGASNYWVSKAIYGVKNSDQRNFVISDLRYKSEVNQLREEFGDDLVTIRINRFDSSPSTDPSELDLVDFEHDFTVDNKGTKEELFSKIQDIVNKKGALNK